MITVVRLGKKVRKQLRKVPGHILDKLEAWTDLVELMGLEKVRQISGFHDEPLEGDRQGQRSIRLNIHWRAIYVIKNHEIEFVEVQEVIHHDY